MINYNDIVERCRVKLFNDTNIKNFSPGSICRAMIEAYAGELYNANLTLDLKIVNALVTTASGTSLDAVGALVNVSRRSNRYATGSVKVYIDPYSGENIASLKLKMNTTNNIIISAGSTVTDSTGIYTYILMSNVMLDDNPVFTEVISNNTGTSGNIPSGTITRFDSVTGLGAIMQYILVTNTTPFDSGGDSESDENYRYRIVNSYTSNATANETAIRLAALSVPGVVDVIMKRYQYGIGSCGLYVISQSPVTSDGLISAVQNAISRVSSYGEFTVVSAPMYKAMMLDIVLMFKSDTSASDKDTLTIQTLNNVITYINNIPVGGEFVANEVTQTIMDTSEQIYDFQTRKIGIGDYNRETGLIDYFRSTLFTNQKVDDNVKLVSNEKLCTTCY